MSDQQTTTFDPVAAAPCPECEAPTAVPRDAVEGEILVCGACGAELELLGLDPVELGLALEVGEDWGE
ncbi:MAG: alpha-aminoadipate/glutamate carrier protein LysW [Planctomycetota bacterium]